MSYDSFIVSIHISMLTLSGMLLNKDWRSKYLYVNYGLVYKTFQQIEKICIDVMLEEIKMLVGICT